MISPNIIIMYDGTHASIPSGFTRETSLDGKFPKGTADSTDPNDTGGASTHTHTSPSHTHTMVNHTHTYTLPQYIGGTEDHGDDGDYSNYIADEPHTHSGTSGDISGGTLSGATTIGSANNDPPYYTVIFIKSSGYNFIPNNAMIFSASTSRAEMSFHTASANKFLVGAGTGANAGATGGGGTHTHSYNHIHPNASHSHLSANSNTTTFGSYKGSYSSSNQHAARQAHIHSVSLNSTSTACNGVTASFTSTTIEPAFRTLNAFKNTSGASQMPKKGDIALWLGSLATIPLGWKLCDGTNGTPDMRDRYVKVPSSASTSVTGGSNTHSHSGVASHTHTATGTHSHSGSCDNSNLNTQTGVGSHSTATVHSHSVTTVQSITTLWNSTTISTDTSNNEPEYRTVAFIQFEFSIGGGAIVTKMLN